MKIICNVCFIHILLCLTFMQVSDGQERTPDILAGPTSILVPVNTSAYFECRAYCAESCSVYWYIDGGVASNVHQRNEFIEKGFTFLSPYPLSQHGSGIYMIRLSVNASVLVNNTQLYCKALIYGSQTTISDRSSNATLLVTTELLVKPNPLVIIQPTAFIVKWSPPYLWPGHRIKYCNISTTNTRTNTVTNDLINATFTDLVVTHEEFLPDQECTEYLFLISAVNYTDGVLQTFTATGGYQRGPDEFGVSSLDTTVYFTSNLTPLVSVSIQLPSRLCYYQELNYTITVDAMNESNIIELGPFHHCGNGTLKHDIMPSEKLKINKEYSVQVILVTYFNTCTSINHTFDTYFQLPKISDSSYNKCTCTGPGADDAQVYHYKIAVYSSGCITLLILLILIIVVMSICTHYHWERYQVITGSLPVQTRNNEAYEIVSLNRRVTPEAATEMNSVDDQVT